MHCSKSIPGNARWTLVCVLTGPHGNLGAPAHKQCGSQSPNPHLAWPSPSLVANTPFAVLWQCADLPCREISPKFLSWRLPSFHSWLSFHCFFFFLCSWASTGFPRANVGITAILQQRNQSHFSIRADNVPIAYSLPRQPRAPNCEVWIQNKIFI